MSFLFLFRRLGRVGFVSIFNHDRLRVEISCRLFFRVYVLIHVGHLPKIKKMIANYTQLRKLIEQLLETNIKLFKEDVRQ